MGNLRRWKTFAHLTALGVMNKMFFIAALVSLSAAGVATTPVASMSDKWWTYLADYDGKPGSIRVDMALREEAPLGTLPVVVIFGTTYEQRPETGLPTDSDLGRLNNQSDNLIHTVLSVQAGVYVGTFTHAGEQVHYVYARSAEGIEAEFKRALTGSCPTCIAVFRTRPDPDWKAYLQFLYPNQATLNHYGVDPRSFRPRR